MTQILRVLPLTFGGVKMLSRAFYLRDATAVAPELLGKLLVHKSPEGLCSGMIVEVEAYRGSCDKGAHSYQNKRTPRTEIQFGPGGYAYVFGIYGLHYCFNVVTNRPMEPDVVLIRALEPVQGIELMQQRRGRTELRELCNGPGKLCQALDIKDAQYGCDLCGEELYLLPFRMPDAEEIMVSPRINIDYAEECKDYLWRYYIKDNPYVSKTAMKYRMQSRAFREKAGGIGEYRGM